MNFLRQHRYHFATITAVIICGFMMSGCAGSFLADAPSIIAAVTASLTGILSVIGILVPGSTALTGVIQVALAEIQEIETLVEQYKTTPDETILQKIEAAIQLAITNIRPLLAPVGVPEAAAAKIGAIAQLILSQLEAWQTIFPASKPNTTSLADNLVHGVPTYAIAKPLTSEQFKSAVNDIAHAPSGDAVTDEAFLKLNV